MLIKSKLEGAGTGSSPLQITSKIDVGSGNEMTMVEDLHFNTLDDNFKIFENYANLVTDFLDYVFVSNDTNEKLDNKIHYLIKIALENLSEEKSREIYNSLKEELGDEDGIPVADY